MCPTLKTKVTMDPRVHELRWDKSVSVPRYRSKRGAEFDENGPNLIEDIDFAIGPLLGVSALHYSTGSMEVRKGSGVGFSSCAAPNYLLLRA